MVRAAIYFSALCCCACGLVLDSGPPREQSRDGSVALDSGGDANDGDGCPEPLKRCGGPTGPCVDLASNTEFCGDCETDCGGGACRAGLCEAIWVDVAAGRRHSCALTSDGEVYCWGNAGPQTGSAGMTGTVTPQQIGGLAGLGLFGTDPLALGDEYSCYLGERNDGNPGVRCWGTASSEVVPGGADSSVALEMASENGTGRLEVTHIRGGDSFVCGIDSRANPDAQFCWGKPSNSNLGFGTATAMPATPLRLDPARPRPETLSAFALGDDYGCISGSGPAGSRGTYCWGDGTGLNLGFDSQNVRLDLEPTFVGTSLVDRPLDQLGLNALVACGRAGTELFCWGGRDVLAEFGTVAASFDAPALYGASDSNAEVPSLVAENIYDFAAGRHHICGARREQGVNEIVCFGVVPPLEMAEGRLVLAASSNPTPVADPSVGGNRTVTDMAAGELHTCALFADHELVCWGANPDGQLGASPSTPGDVLTFAANTLCSPEVYKSGRACP